MTLALRKNGHSPMLAIVSPSNTVGCRKDKGNATMKAIAANTNTIPLIRNEYNAKQNKPASSTVINRKNVFWLFMRHRSTPLARQAIVV